MATLSDGASSSSGPGAVAGIIPARLESRALLQSRRRKMGQSAEAKSEMSVQRLAATSLECQDATAQIADYLTGSLPVEEFDGLLTHAAACARAATS